MSEFTEWAREEVQRAGLLDEDSDYNGMLGREVLKLCETFSDAGHSGMSAAFAAQIFERLAAYKPLTPLTDDPAEWMDVADYSNGGAMWQSRRNPACFSYDGGKRYYDIDETLPRWRRMVAKALRRRPVQWHRSDQAQGVSV